MPALLNLEDFDQRNSNNSLTMAVPGRKSISDNTPTPKKFEFGN